MISFPNINPTAFSFFGIDIQWYGIAYAAGLLLGLFYSKKIINNKNTLQKEAFDDLIFWIALGTIIGGRLGYVIFYDLGFYLNNMSLIILDIRKGGMSFHGGLLGVILSTYIFCKRKKLNFLQFMDVIACAAPIGIFFGRITNFINSELWGKPTSLPWGVVFPNGGQTPRHPSQIYEAFLEGLLLFIILNYFYRKKFFITGYCASLFLILYGTFRVFIEFIREPDSHLGYLFGNFWKMKKTKRAQRSLLYNKRQARSLLPFQHLCYKRGVFCFLQVCCLYFNMIDILRFGLEERESLMYCYFVIVQSFFQFIFIFCFLCLSFSLFSPSPIYRYLSLFICLHHL